MVLRLTSAALLCLLLLGTVSAQKDKAKKGYLPPNYKKLDLTADQETKIRKIRADYKAKLDALKKQMDKLKQEEKDSYFKVLTEAQKKKYRKLVLGEDDDTPKDKPKKDSTKDN